MLKKQYSKTKPVCKVTFSLPTAAVGEVKEVKLLGDFNNWSVEEGILLKPGKSEYKATVELETGRTYEFRYLADGATWLNDHAADDYQPSPFPGIDNSVLHLEAATIAVPKPKKSAPAKKEKKKTTAPDDLKKIEGIGPKIEKLLNDAGILTFQDLAGAKKKTLQDVLAGAGPRFRMHDPATWTKQAALAAKGAWDKLEALQDELKGGRKK